ncbi:hypothetical protein AHF37_04782 [Paragonimus kellicotti]|nr:hypothetical protein AHF37_04782 [Paragonimus kellicotti]
MPSGSIRQHFLEDKLVDSHAALEWVQSLNMAYQQSVSFRLYDFSHSTSISDPDSPKHPETFSHESGVSATADERCYSCGYAGHPRFNRPARDAVCKTCCKKRYFRKICRSAQDTIATSTASSSLPSIILAVTPQCL